MNWFDISERSHPNMIEWTEGQRVTEILVVYHENVTNDSFTDSIDRTDTAHRGYFAASREHQ